MPSEPTRVRSKSIKKRQQILDAAARALAQQGYSEAKLSDIAQEVGTHAGSLYYYFPSREDLVREVLMTSLDRLSDQFTEAMKESQSQLSPLDRIKAFVRVVVARRTSAQDDYLAAYMRTFNQVPDNIREDLATRRLQMRQNLAQLLSDAQAAGEIPFHIDVNLAALFIVGATNWVGVWYKPTGPKTADEISETFVDLVLHGLAGPQG